MAEESSGPNIPGESSGVSEGSSQIKAKTTSTSFKLFVFQFFFAIPLIAVALLYFGDDIQTLWERQYGYGSVPDYGLPPALMQQFSEFDGDANGCIDPDEFAVMSIANQRTAEGFSPDINDVEIKEAYVFEDPESGPGKSVIAIKAEMTPLNITTMSKFANWNDYLVGDPSKLVPGLTSWKNAVRDYDFYGTGNFKVFLPTYGKITVGEPYYIIPAQEGVFSMNRYQPNTPSTKHALIYAILSQFHPNIFLISRFGPVGSVGVIRAMNEKTVEVMFRIHAEYQLNKLPDYPFWFTPGQFTGRLVIDLDGSYIHYFELHLPTDKHLNVDMEWISGPGANEVDIGFMAKMKAAGSTPVPWKPEMELPEELLEDNYQPPEVDIAWTSEITREDALRKLEVLMYPFKKVYYHSFLDAITSAVSSNKLIHMLVLWGALDDQSC